MPPITAYHQKFVVVLKSLNLGGLNDSVSQTDFQAAGRRKFYKHWPSGPVSLLKTQEKLVPF